ncbi:ABC transporter ATP-binding protein [Akkermansiaceae bacterium]|nr:ABC transporter ATP-binding protein [Akkermansiaceae bacterium]MDA8980679.1 ABC transporter ATP-binding protein [bacterium]MDA8968642.1 ABC transporter ATP-binding protein [Akkermansiaceae bacterium]MDB0056063.1 ABC transporter ATP-binding protein [Akkermansiaceae bacterium]MDB4257673.1 ABC transporter ATP-binding protein [bacterium]
MISLRNLSVSYETPAGPVPVLSDLDIEITDGQAIAIVGPSGSGKTTLLNVIGAMLPPTSGEVTVGGENISSLSEKEAAKFRNRQLGFVFQQHYLLPQLTVLENVLVPRLAGGWDEKESETRARAEALLERVGLGHRLTHLPSALSGGEKQRVAVARALINEPSLILADEPTGALDSETGEKVADLLLEVQQEKGVTLVVVTHDLDLAARVSGKGDPIRLS